MVKIQQPVEVARLYRFLVRIDQDINNLDRLAFESAYIPANESGRRQNLQEQEARAKSAEFVSPAKNERDRVLRYRNQIAGALGFRERAPHEWNWQDYEVRDGTIVFGR